MKNYYTKPELDQEYYCLIPIDASDINFEKYNISLFDFLSYHYPNFTKELLGIKIDLENISEETPTNTQEEAQISCKFLNKMQERKELIDNAKLPSELACIVNRKTGIIKEYITEARLQGYFPFHLTNYECTKKRFQEYLTHEYHDKSLNYFYLTEELIKKR